MVALQAEEWVVVALQVVRATAEMVEIVVVDVGRPHVAQFMAAMLAPGAAANKLLLAGLPMAQHPWNLLDQGADLSARTQNTNMLGQEPVNLSG